jgi:hypothetical protein
MASLERLEIRSIIKFCQEEGETPSKTYKRILGIKGKASVSRTLVFDWHKRFREGMTDIGQGRTRKKEENYRDVGDVNRRDVRKR